MKRGRERGEIVMAQSFRRADGAPPLICGHRGNSRAAPENTLAALKATVDAGGTAAEIDAVLSADGEVVILHDLLVDRTTDGAGPAAEMPLAALKQLDAGGWFAPAFAGERIPTLAETLSFAHEHDFMLEVEIKEKRNLVGMAEALARALADPRDRKRVMLLSFDHVWLCELKDRIPEIKTAGIVQSRLADPLAVAQSARLDQLSIDFSVFDPKQAIQLRDEGLSLRCHAYDPDKIAVMDHAGLAPRRRLIGFLRDGLIDTLSGDDVAWLADLVDEARG